MVSCRQVRLISAQVLTIFFQDFQKSLDASEPLKELCSRAELLQLHGYYKQAMYGDNTMGRPLMQDIYGLAKWQHWRDLVNVSEEVARGKYCQLVEQYLVKYKNCLGG